MKEESTKKEKSPDLVELENELDNALSLYSSNIYDLKSNLNKLRRIGDEKIEDKKTLADPDEENKDMVKNLFDKIAYLNYINNEFIKLNKHLSTII